MQRKLKKQMIFLSELLRIKQWTKNFFIFFPLLFSGKLFQAGQSIDCLITFFGFCFVSSGVYIFNDLTDIKSDQAHPRKSKRPLAEGKIKTVTAIYIVPFLIALGLWILTRVNLAVISVALTYITLNIFYNFYAKKIVIIDVFLIATGFYLRVWAGSLAIDVLPSVWLQLCVFLLALFLGFTKRRYEISTLKDRASEHRLVLAHYTSYLLDQIIIICSTLTIVFYGLYTVSPDIVNRIGNHNMIYSIAFVIYGIFRYLYLVHVKKLGDDPGEVILSDIPLLFSIILWTLYIAVTLYTNHALLSF